MEEKKSKKANLENKKLLFIEVGLCFSLFVTLAAFQWGTRDANVRNSVPVAISSKVHTETRIGILSFNFSEICIIRNGVIIQFSIDNIIRHFNTITNYFTAFDILLINSRLFITIRDNNSSIINDKARWLHQALHSW